jgi:hypothetical protein
MFSKIQETAGIAFLALSSLSFTTGCNSEPKDKEPTVIKAPILLQTLRDLNADSAVRNGVDLVSAISDSRLLLDTELKQALSDKLAKLLPELNTELEQVSDEGKKKLLVEVAIQKARECCEKNVIKFLEAVEEKLNGNQQAILGLKL